MAHLKWHIKPELILEDKKIQHLCEKLNLNPEEDFLPIVVETLDTLSPQKTILESCPSSNKYTTNIQTSSCDFTTNLAWELIEITQLSYTAKDLSANNSDIKLYPGIPPKEFKIIFASIEKKLREIFNSHSNQSLNASQIEKVITSIHDEILEQIDNKKVKDHLQDKKINKKWAKSLKIQLNRDKKTLESRNNFFNSLQARLSKCQFNLNQDEKTELALNTQILLAKQIYSNKEQAEKFGQLLDALFIGYEASKISNTYCTRYEVKINSPNSNTDAKTLTPSKIINLLSHLNKFGLYATFDIENLLTNHKIKQQGH